MSLNGIDISSYQTGLELSQVPCDFVVVKATEGTTYLNPSCYTHAEQALRLGKKLGFYHYASVGNAEEEADWFLQCIGSYIDQVVLVLDWEGRVTEEGQSWAKSWLDRVYMRTGVRPLIYMNNGMVNRVDWSIVVRGNYGLWNAGYYNGDTPMGYNPNAPIYGELGAWGNCAMYQYTSSGRLPGWNGNLDLNVFYGDRDAWDAYARKEGESGPRVAEARMELQTGEDNQRIYAEDAGDGYIYLRNKAVNLYLDIPGADAVNDAVLQWYEKNETDAQKWKIVYKTNGLAQYTFIEPKLAPGKYVSVENNGLDGKRKIKLWDELPSAKQQFWVKRADDESYVFVHTYSLLAISAKL